MNEARRIVGLRPATDADARAALVARIEARLPAETEIPGGFTAALFARAAMEDLEAFAAEDLAGAVAAAFLHLREPRHVGAEEVHLFDREVSVGGRARRATVVQCLNDNMPFLVDSTLAALVERGAETLLVLHPILAVERDEAGRLVRFAGEALSGAPAGARRESLIQIHVRLIEEEAERGALVEELHRVYADVRVAVRDWAAMRGRLLEAAHAYRADPPPLPHEETSEAIAFLEWLTSDNFTFLGMRSYAYREDTGSLEAQDGTGLGILRDASVHVLRRGRDLVAVTPEVQAFLEQPLALINAKANVKARVHRRAHLDYIGMKSFTSDGRLQGELRIVGLFTADAYTGSTTAIPYIRHKVAKVVRRAGFDPASHSGRALLNVLEAYPRDELFQIDADTLYRFALDIQALTERPRVRVLARPDRFDRFVSVLVFAPKDRWDTNARRRVGEFLASVFGGRVSAAYPAFPEGPLARTHYIIGRDEGPIPHVERDKLEAGVSGIVRIWADMLREALGDSGEGAERRRVLARYADAFSAAYREGFSASEAVTDIAIIEALTGLAPHAVDFVRRQGSDRGRANLKVFARGVPLPLSERVPIVEDLGFRVVNERTYRIVPRGAPEEERVWLHDMTLECSVRTQLTSAQPGAGTRAPASGDAIDVEALAPGLEAALMAVFQGRAESDGYNALVVEAGLSWQDVACVRALSRTLRQAGIAYSQDYMAGTLARHPGVAADLVALMRARFDPAGEPRTREAREGEALARIEAALTGVTSLDEDRILRRFVNLVRSAVRTNMFQRGPQGGPREAIAFKFESRRVEGLPAPRPLYEIHVYAPRVEGVHLRFGKVARGGLRWSDRPQDFRTEVLGLVKAQQVKNAVIVPVGAKGGFVPKRLPEPNADRAAWMKEGTDAYKLFVSTLLDLTDNIAPDGRIVPPPLTVRHDGDDPYLVVAADKGTATFSDTANAISVERGHWLGDAFASGGSSGYDHKVMGITARGAWEAVRRHFREIDVDVQTQAFSAAGVGDMSGDVFGNGMLLSRTTRLVAAFDHRDIFIDPDPADADAAWTERMRLFGMPRSSWADYDSGLISPGGGVFSRALKSVPLSPEAQGVLGFDKPEATPAEVMNAILKAPVDLLWFGGIGTYVRSSEESEEAAGDRANDAVRASGAEIRARVIGEGANLGMTQRGRIEAARRGVRLNTDAIDNSAGVNTSDVEVNIKIALSVPERDGRLLPQDRDAFLESMTEEVARLVLRNNYLQTLALSLAERRGAEDLPHARRLMGRLEEEGRLVRAVEHLPGDAALSERERRAEGLTRPEIAVLLAYAKLALKDALLESPVPDDPYLSRELERSFPGPMRERFPDAIAGHRLRREIVATALANAIVNRGGPTVVERVAQASDADAVTVAGAYAAVRDSLGLLDLNTSIDALDGQVAGETQLALYGEVQDVLLASLARFARRLARPGAVDLAGLVETHRNAAERLLSDDGELLPPAATEAARARAGELVKSGVPEDVARRLARLRVLTAVPDLVEASERIGRPLEAVARLHFALAEAVPFAHLAEAGPKIPVGDDYERRARDRAVEAIAGSHARLTETIAAREGGLEAWLGEAGERAGAAVAETRTILASGLNLPKLVVAAGLMADLARG